MSRQGLSVVALAGVIALAASSPVGRAEGRLHSGVRGKVLYGPTCPVERIGQTCVKPYETTLRIRKRATRKVVARTRSGTDGRFIVRLAPGRYIIEPVSGRPYPHASPQPVLVRRHEFTKVTIEFDSGIR
jgi:hypothetical protein